MIGIGLHGSNGHQIHEVTHEKARIVAVCGCEGDWDGVKKHATLQEMLADPDVTIVSLCSPSRATQAEDAILCMEAGKHVFAEKPCAMSVRDLDKIIAVSKKTGRIFHEMAGTAFVEPYFTMGRLVAQGTIGEVVQVFAQKSYPYHEKRPQDENIDGGLICQCGIHAIRFIEHVAGRKIVGVAATETPLGNPVESTFPDGGLQMAASLIMELDNGGVASAVLNYLNPKGFGVWGNEHLRIFGTKGFMECTDGGSKTRLVVGTQDKGPIELEVPERRYSWYFDQMIDQVLGTSSPPLSIEEELSPTRVVILAKESVGKGTMPV